MNTSSRTTPIKFHRSSRLCAPLHTFCPVPSPEYKCNLYCQANVNKGSFNESQVASDSRQSRVVPPNDAHITLTLVFNQSTPPLTSCPLIIPPSCLLHRTRCLIHDIRAISAPSRRPTTIPRPCYVPYNTPSFCAKCSSSDEVATNFAGGSSLYLNSSRSFVAL